MSAPGPPPFDGSPVEGRTGSGRVASGEPLTPGTGLVGRERELARIDAVLREAADRASTALVLEGDPGVGKTTLLDAARIRAAGFTCLSARGTASESHLAYAGLLGLLHPVRDLLPELPSAQAGALRAALGWSTSADLADRFLVGAATLSLLAAAAERAPVLVLVDDLQWLDAESSAAVLFAARRLGPDAVAFLMARRPDGAGATADDLPVLRLGGLDVPAAAGLLPRATAPAVLERLVTDTAGNPLALLEVSRRLDAAQLLGTSPLPDALPAGELLRSRHEAAVLRLSPAARRAVLLLALSGTSSSAVAAAVAALGASEEQAAAVLDEARAHGVLVLEGGQPSFRHPLLRSTVLELAAPQEQRAAHAALAEALPSEDRARTWHLAECTVGTDDHVAEGLARLADSDRLRLGYAAASAALERAATLTNAPVLAAQRLATAADDAFLAGDVARVRSLIARVLAGDAPGQVRGEAFFTLGMLEQYAGSVPRAIDHLADASLLLDGLPLARALTELALAHFRLNDVAGMLDCARRIEVAADATDPEQQLLAAFTGGVGLVLTGDPVAGAARLSEVRRLAGLPSLRHDARALLLMALSAAFTGQVGEVLAVGSPRVEELRRRGAVGVMVPLLAVRAAGRAWLGDHAGAFADAGEAAELAVHLGYAADAAVAEEMLAWQQAARGMHEDARASLVRAGRLTDRAGTTAAAAHQALTAAFCALCRGDLDAVVTLLEQRLALDGGVGASGEPLGVAPLLVEAYAGLGRDDDARALTSRLAEVTPTPAPALTVALLHRCEALGAADGEEARRAFEAALDSHAAADDPFEEARTRLQYGGRLRRDGQRVAARAQLGAAGRAFDSMDLDHWSAVAARELAATGATARRRPAAGEAPLTSQETRVALLAARGLSNREIGASLFLSPKTVERHLTSVYRKRGFRSRTELAAAMARSSPPPA
ncbi:helix-turn-helix transcriptional regulator [Nocardioides sediminis]|uniref:helix-turn-helix transcriptional regulator n=1 Tax=Nocardioides sediminis TaxID=433648 RepID=UPI000D30B29B|nr:AAA family ATPase [Nocardioides sediminis]